jgi:hypothetical protein
MDRRRHGAIRLGEGQAVALVGEDLGGVRRRRSRGIDYLLEELARI